jgi:uncharacterized membrane protein YbhN (UPF0104 family)
VNTETNIRPGDSDVTPQRAPLWKWVSRVVIIVGIAWVIAILARDFESLQADFRIASVGWLAFTVLLGIIALLLFVPVFRALLSAHSELHIGILYAARMLFVAQILRHLPGRIWGIVYLVAETRPSIPSTSMVRANLDTMIYSMCFSLLIAVILLLDHYYGAYLAVGCCVLGIVSLAAAVRHDWLGRLLLAMARILPGRAAKFLDRLPQYRTLPWPAVAKVVTCTALSWACYLLVWWSFMHIFPVLADVDIWLLCASYCAAWFIGYVSMVTPSGIGVREASFFALASTLTSLPNLAFLAVFIRIWQIVAEIAVFLIFAFAKPTVTATE